MPWPSRSGRSASTTSPISSTPYVAAFLADVNRHAEPAVARQVDVLTDLRVVVSSASRARAGDVDADDPARPIAKRLFHDHHVLVGAERAVHHQQQPRTNLRVLQRRDVETSCCGQDDVVEVALAAAVPLHRVEAELERRDALRTVRAADRGMHTAFDRQRRALNELGEVVDPIERVEIRDAARIGHRDETVELLVVARRQMDPLLVREAPHDVRRDRATEVGVELGEAFLEHAQQSMVAR